MKRRYLVFTIPVAVGLSFGWHVRLGLRHGFKTGESIDLSLWMMLAWAYWFLLVASYGWLGLMFPIWLWERWSGGGTP